MSLGIPKCQSGCLITENTSKQDRTDFTNSIVRPQQQPTTACNGHEVAATTAPPRGRVHLPCLLRLLRLPRFGPLVFFAAALWRRRPWRNETRRSTSKPTTASRALRSQAQARTSRLTSHVAFDQRCRTRDRGHQVAAVQDTRRSRCRIPPTLQDTSSAEF